MPQIRLGLRENLPQFALLVVVNAFVGAMIGLERAILPAVAEQAFHLAARTAILSFIVVFGVTKAMVNYAAGRWSDRIGRKRVLVTGWLTAIPVPWLLMWAPSWPWILWANALLGVSQGLTWSTTVIMKIDLVGPKQRGLAMGLNECAGYVAVGLSALATGYLASRYAVRPEPFYPGVIYAAAGLLLSAVFVRETHGHARHEARAHVSIHPPTRPHRNLAIINETGFVNNLNDRRPVGSHRAQVAHCLGHVDPGRQHCDGRDGPRLSVIRGVCGVARRWHSDGLPDAARGCRRRGAPVVARIGDWTLSVMA